MSQYRILLESGKHDSGTKVYRVIMVTSERDNPGVVLTNWGKTPPAGASSSPRYYGQSKVELFDGSREAVNRLSSARREKQKRGYTFRTSVDERVDETEVRKWIEAHFPPAKAEAAIRHLFSARAKEDVLESEHPEEDLSEIATPVMPPPVKIAPASESFQDWGTW